MSSALNTNPAEKELPRSFAQIRSQYSYLRSIYAERNGEYEILRGLFDGTLVQEQRNKAIAGKLTANRTELIYNVLNAAVRRYMDQQSSPPRFDGVPRGFELGDIELADKRAKLIEDVWDANNKTTVLMQAAFYQALLDKAIFNVRPAPHLPMKVKIELAVPEFYYPITKGDNWQEPEAVIYGFRHFKDDYYLKDPMRFKADEDLDTIIEYWDKNWFCRLEGERALVLYHGLGVVLWEEAHNIPIPHRHRGQGDGDQIVGLQEYLNMLLGSFADMIAYAANPIAVVRGTKVGGTNLPFEPRAVWELERDAQVGFLQWSGAPPTSEAQILRVFQGIEDLTGVSSPAFGREIPSGTSGNAIRSLLAGFNTRLGTKQQLMGDCLVRINCKVQLVLEKMFPNESFEVNGENVSHGTAMGKPQRYEVKPKEFGGWYKNRAIFNPLDVASTYFQEIDKFSKGIQSRYTTMKALGVTNVWDELERIRVEKREEADNQNNLALAGKGEYVSPERAAAQTAEDSAALGQIGDQLKGLIRPSTGASPNGQQQRDDKKVTKQLALQDPGPSAIQEPQGPAGPSALAEPTPMLEDVLAKLRSAGISGRAALGGDIVKAGKGKATISLQNPQDADTIRKILGPVATGVTFQGLDPERQLSPDQIEFGQKKKVGAESRRTKGYLSMVVIRELATNNAMTYEVGLLDEKGSLIPFGKTNPQREIRAEQGEIIRVKVGGLTRREDGGTVKWGLVAPTPVHDVAPAAKPSSIKDLERLWESGE